MILNEVELRDAQETDLYEDEVRSQGVGEGVGDEVEGEDDEDEEEPGTKGTDEDDAAA